MFKVISGLMTGLLFAGLPAAQAADSTITVSGRIVSMPCVVSTKNATINMGDLPASDYTRAGSASKWFAVTMNLSSCPAGTSSVKATFSGTADATGYYKNQGSAGNIQLQIQDEKSINLNNGSSKQVAVNTTTKAAVFPLWVRAVSVSGGAVQGTIQSVISITYTYS
ncbi:type 1 fimbrial minor subunit FimG [Dryocola clanedunensis]